MKEERRTMRWRHINEGGGRAKIKGEDEDESKGGEQEE